MPRYDYRCELCGWEGERDVPVQERDAQTCRNGTSGMPDFIGDRVEDQRVCTMSLCDHPLTRVFNPTGVRIEIPPYMTAAAVHKQDARNGMPVSEKAKKRWKETDVERVRL